MKKIRLGDLVNTSSGSTPLSSNKEYYENGDIPWINSGEVGQYKINFAEKFITKEGFEKSNTKIFPKDTILVAMYGATAGKTSILNINACTNQAVCAILPSENVNNIYLKYKLDSIYDYLVQISSGSARDNLSQKVIQDLEINLPPLKTQQKIAKILSDIDDKIEILHQINDNLAELAKTIYDYWFVQFDFPDENGKPYKSSGGKMVYNEVLKREIPEGWEVKKLKKYAFIKKGTLITEKQANTNGNIKVVSAGLDFSYYHDKSNFLENTITISASGANAGFINFWREPIFACDCTTVRGNNLTETLYIYQFLKILQDYIYQQAKGSAQPHIYPKDIEDLNIIIPNENEIKKYGEYVNDLNQKILLNLKEIQLLQSLRDWFLPMLMNGQISVE